VIDDDQTITRSGIRSLLAAQEDTEIVGESQNSEDAMNSPRQRSQMSS